MHPTSWQSVDHTLDACIKCNICTSYCPVAAVTDLFPGPKYAGPQAQRFRENGQPHSPDHSVDYCSGCRVCNEVCPTGVRIAEINARARAQIVQEQGIPLRNRLLGRNELLGKVGSVCAGSRQFRSCTTRPAGFLAEQVMGIARDAPLPRWSTSGTFGDWMKRTRDERLKSDKKVVYYHGCATMYYEPFVGKAAVAVLEHLGYEVLVPAPELLWPAHVEQRRILCRREVPPEQRGSPGRLCPSRPTHCRHKHELYAYPAGRSA